LATEPASAKLVNKRRQRPSNIGGWQRPEPQSPSAIELLTKGVHYAGALELFLVPLGSAVTRLTVEGGVEPVATIVDRPNRDSIWHGSSVRR
jgi:hypothetical protein